MKQKIPITVEQVAANLGKGAMALDQVRAAQIAGGLRLESAKSAVYLREHERLRQKYGPEHPRTKDMSTRARGNAEYRAELITEYRAAATPMPEAGAGWAVDGFVRTSGRAPVSGVTVAAADRQGRWLEEFGYACANDQGYFQLIAEKIPEKETRVYMRAFERGVPLESNENRMAPAAGRVDRIEIILERSAKGDCTPPDGGVPAPPGPPSKPRPESPKPADKTAEPAVAEVIPPVKAAQPAAADTTPPAKAAAQAKAAKPTVAKPTVAKPTVAKPTRAQKRARKRAPNK